MDINKAWAMINLINNQKPTQPIPIPVKVNNQEVDLNYIIQNKPPTKIVRSYFENNIMDLEESE
jgi:hypothetical protein